MWRFQVNTLRDVAVAIRGQSLFLVRSLYVLFVFTPELNTKYLKHTLYMNFFYHFKVLSITLVLSIGKNSINNGISTPCRTTLCVYNPKQVKIWCLPVDTITWTGASWQEYSCHICKKLEVSIRIFLSRCRSNFGIWRYLRKFLVHLVDHIQCPRKLIQLLSRCQLSHILEDYLHHPKRRKCLHK